MSILAVTVIGKTYEKIKIILRRKLFYISVANIQNTETFLI